ncbi:hypothetical protein WN943_002832 [Citrus x changshan-huyou]
MTRLQEVALSRHTGLMLLSPLLIETSKLMRVSGLMDYLLVLEVHLHLHPAAAPGSHKSLIQQNRIWIVISSSSSTSSSVIVAAARSLLLLLLLNGQR